MVRGGGQSPLPSPKKSFIFVGSPAKINTKSIISKKLRFEKKKFLMQKMSARLIPIYPVNILSCEGPLMKCKLFQVVLWKSVF